MPLVMWRWIKILIFSVFNENFVGTINIVQSGPRYLPTKGEVWPKPQFEHKENIYYTFTPNIQVESCRVVQQGPMYLPTKGEVWPKPQFEHKENFYYTFTPNIQVEVTGQNCTILSKAIKRYSHVFHNLSDLRRFKYQRESRAELATSKKLGDVKSLQIQLTRPCEEYPYFRMDEKYQLSVSTVSHIKSSSIWGVLRGLETFAQLIYPTDDFHELRINKTTIVDYPHSTHRGILLDTSRHFISLVNIFTMLDAMVMNKMNVFHWHIVDDQSFPYQSQKYPDLSAKGAYHPTMVYSKTDIENIIEYARDRGIRVVPEFDVPGHTSSWGAAYPGLLTECYYGDRVIGLGSMNPTKEIVYKLLKELFDEVQSLFSDEYLHIGGDEVDSSCWESNPEINKYMKTNNVSAKNLQAVFMNYLMPMLWDRSAMIIWQEAFLETAILPRETIVHFWKVNSENEMIEALKLGYRTLYSSPWYLDHLNEDFLNMYNVDPWRNINNATIARNFVGGEACMWGEMVDDRNFLSRMWPRASAAAERLWNKKMSNDNLFQRIEEHVCRMIRRGVPAQPAIGPGFCVV